MITVARLPREQEERFESGIFYHFWGHVQQLSKTFYGKKNNRVPYFETLTAILKTILLEIEKSSPLTKHMPNKCGVVKNASRRSILARSSDGRASDC